MGKLHLSFARLSMVSKFKRSHLQKNVNGAFHCSCMGNYATDLNCSQRPRAHQTMEQLMHSRLLQSILTTHCEMHPLATERGGGESLLKREPRSSQRTREAFFVPCV